MKDNRGLSLVELIIVIALIGVLATMFIAGTGYIPSSAAKSLSSSVKTAIGETRIKTLGRQETAFYFYKDANDGRYYKQYLTKTGGSWQEPEPPELIGKHHPRVRYSIDNGSNFTEMADGTGLTICFDRKTGKEIAGYINDEYNRDSSGALIKATGLDLQYIKCTDIEISGGGTVCDIKIEPATGKVTLE